MKHRLIAAIILLALTGCAVQQVAWIPPEGMPENEIAMRRMQCEGMTRAGLGFGFNQSLSAMADAGEFYQRCLQANGFRAVAVP